MHKILLILSVSLSCLYCTNIEIDKKRGRCAISCQKCVVLFMGDFDKYKASFKDQNDYYDAMEHHMIYQEKIENYIHKQKIVPKIDSVGSPDCPIITYGDFIFEVPQDRFYGYILFEKGKPPYLIYDTVITRPEINAYFGIKDSQTSAESLND